jgi:hypothetical protein
MVNYCSLLTICRHPSASSTRTHETQTARAHICSKIPQGDLLQKIGSALAGDYAGRVQGRISVKGTVSFQKWDRCQQKAILLPNLSLICVRDNVRESMSGVVRRRKGQLALG